MSKTKKWLIAAVLLIVFGTVNCAVASAALGFNFNRLETTEFVTSTYEVADDFENIDIEADTEKIDFIYADEGVCKVVCVEEKNNPHIVRVENDTLKISQKPGGFNLNMGVGLHEMTITVYLPKDSFGDLKIAADTGNVNIPSSFGFENIEAELNTGTFECSASANQLVCLESDTGAVKLSGMNPDTLSVSTDTGNIILSDIKAAELSLESDTGKATMTNCIADNLNVITSTGNITFDKCDGNVIYAVSDTGNITGTLLSGKIFNTESDTGRIDVPASTNGGTCEMATDTGNIQIEVVE